MTDPDYIAIGMLVAAVVLLAVAVDLATRGPERRAAKRLRKMFVQAGVPTIRAMPRRKK